MIYFDNSATTPMAPQAIDEFTQYMNESFGNPSSRHALGLDAAKRLGAARETIAKKMGASTDEIYFTSGGTEGDNIAVLGGANIKKGGRVVTTAVEHPAVLRAMDYLESSGYEVVRIMPQSDGSISPSEILNAVNEKTSLVSIMHVNNETGAIMPVDKIGKAIKRIAPRAIFHVDAVQSFGHILFKPSAWDVDTASVSSHKIHGPKGVGALYVRKGVSLKPCVFGGGQEKNLRSGTENVGAICAFAKACELIDYTEAQKVLEIKNFLKSSLLEIEGTVLNGGENDSPYILNISFGKIRSEILLNAFSNEGIYVSSGSACASGHHGSHVLDAMKAPLPDSAIRFSFSRYNTIDEGKKVAEAAKRITAQLA
ncbi:MAG: cysteine desulfurase family protein [Clostridia bacterium]|nr:cysteine desulfurase family protein [Clostridia bacterium]